MHAHGGSPDPLDRTRFPVDEWALRETRYSAEDLGVTETLFAVGNGYLGLRGNCEEGRDTHAHGTFVNGFHETWQIRHAEEAFGFARTGQTIVNAPDVKTIKLYVDDEPLLLSVADLEHYDRTLDFRDGVLRRSLIWRTASGKRVQVVSRRFTSLEHRHLAVMTFEVTMLDGDAPVAISSQLLNRQDGLDEYTTESLGAGDGTVGFDPRKASTLSERVLVPQSHWAGDRRMVLSWRAANSRMTLAVGVDHTISTDNEYETLTHAEEDLAKKVYRVRAQQGRPILVTKVAAYHSSRGVPTRELVDRCRRTLDRVREDGVEQCFASQRREMHAFWERSDVVVAGHPAVEQAVRWNLFQLAQSSLRVETAGIAAKGVSGSGYEGHYFWDSEIYVLPFLTYTSPWVARGALRFRHQMLPAARRRAYEMSQAGALFPWRTISGEEASAYYAAGTAQYHINADIAFALCKYVSGTGDEDFMVREGVEILVETARMWEDLGFWLAGKEPRFHIHGVTGPDEYTAVVNNNLFTNLMARDNLRQAAAWCRHIAEFWPEQYARLVKQLELEPGEVDEWARCADGMYVPYDEGLKVHPQDQHFLEREVWDLAATPEEKRPLLLHYHPLVIYRFQVLKQADVVAALFLQGDEFSREAKRADFEYYDPITTGDSSLSAVVQAIMAAEVGYQDLALRYFHAGLYVDLANLHGNASDGIHVASTGGVWSALVYGFGGMRDHNDALTFDPRLPRDWPSLSFKVRFHGARMRVLLKREQISFTIEEGAAVSVSVRGEQHLITPGAPVVIPLEDQGPVLEGALGTMPLIGSSTEHNMVYTAGVPDPDRRKKGNGNGNGSR
ncbi:glycoside hydrolase family 65 protein [Pseudactinotalea terrae]|uniref:glycoside hydrolase family 65 protein n=1 Tax=Pseudactinotalea terrae TaxID=1743262 RepID=UPI001F4F60B2|nr:glycosyl hydrolase family 65 protein [Pseudactinotalea terrae]